MRRVFLLTISFSLLGGLFLSPASAAVKAGTACTKLNQTTISSGYVYVCLKSGKKLVWVKGVKVPVSNPKPSPSPSPVVSPDAKPSPSPIATETPVVIPALTPTPKPSPTKTVHPNMTKPVINVVLTPGMKSYGVSYDFQPGDEHYDLIIFESLTGEFKGEQYIVYVGNAKSVSINTADFAPRWINIRTRDQYSDLNISEVRVGPVTPKNPDPDTTYQLPPLTNVQVYCRVNDSSPWVLCSKP